MRAPVNLRRWWPLWSRYSQGHSTRRLSWLGRICHAENATFNLCRSHPCRFHDCGFHGSRFHNCLFQKYYWHNCRCHNLSKFQLSSSPSSPVGGVEQLVGLGFLGTFLPGTCSEMIFFYQHHFCSNFSEIKKFLAGNLLWDENCIFIGRNLLSDKNYSCRELALRWK